MKNSILEYLFIIKTMKNSAELFEKITKIYTKDGFLFIKLNKYLRLF